MPAFDSLYRERAALWPVIYHHRETQLGATATLIPFGDQEAGGKVNAATFLGVRHNASGLAPTWTPNEALSAWDTPFDLTNPANWQGAAPVLTFNGTDEEMDTPDATYWSRGTGADDDPVSIGFWINIANTATQRSLLNKFAGAGAREWTLDVRTDETVVFTARDESVPISVTRATDAAIPTDSWVFLVLTYDGTAGATAMNGAAIYVNGASVASTATNDATYVAMEDLAAVVELGDTNNSNFFAGKMLGGPFCPFFVQAALTAAQVANLYRVERHALGV